LIAPGQLIPHENEGKRRVKWRSAAISAALGLPVVVGTGLLLRSGLGGDDFQPTRWLATGVGPAYGESYLYAYPLPVYLPALPLAAFPSAWSHAFALVVCVILLALALWLWNTTWRNWFFVMTSTPAVYALITTHVFSCAALLGCALAFWAIERRRTPVLLGVGLAMAAIRPINTLPLLAVIVWSQRAEWRRLAAAGATAVLVWTPFTIWAFIIDGRWPLDYIAMLHSYPIAGLIHFVFAMGPFAYAVALVALVALSLAIAAYRGLEAGAVAGMALSVVVAPLPGTYAAIFALPALLVSGRRRGYEWLPGIVLAIGWLVTILLLALNLPPSIAAYWYVINGYPLLRPEAMRRVVN
jgi:hypothetical protein